MTHQIRFGKWSFEWRIVKREPLPALPALQREPRLEDFAIGTCGDGKLLIDDCAYHLALGCWREQRRQHGF